MPEPTGSPGGSHPPHEPWAAARIRELEQQRARLIHGLVDVRADIERAQVSWAWRLGHLVTSTLRRVSGRRPRTAGALARALARIDSLVGAAPAPAGAARRLGPGSDGLPSPGQAVLGPEIRRRLGPPPQLSGYPAVSIIVPASGARSLHRLLEGLRHRTDYPDLEVIVLSAGALELAGEQGGGGPSVRVVACGEGSSFSDACQLGASESAAELLLFLSDQVDPCEAGWLRELVYVAQRDGAAAAGPTLLRAFRGAEVPVQGWVVEQRGLCFRRQGQEIIPFRLGDGDELFGPQFGADRPCPGMSSASLLVQRARFEEVGGFSPGYDQQLAGLDLGMKLRSRGGETVGCGRAVLFHHAPLPAAAGRTSTELLHSRWGPTARRAFALDLLEGQRVWSDLDGPRIGITITGNGRGRGADDPSAEVQLGEALAGLGWAVTYLDRRAETCTAAGLDYLLLTTSEFDVRVAAPGVVVVGWSGEPHAWRQTPWFDRLDVIVDRGPPSADRLREVLRERLRSPSFCLKIGAPDWEVAERGGDLHFARAVQSELRRRSHPCRIQVRAEWDGPEGLDDDVVIHIRGRGRNAPRPGQFNVLWSISHPDELSALECDVYDLVCVASARFAADLRPATSTPVIVLEQATDPRIFFAEPDPRYAHELVFVGNSRGVARRILRDLIPTSHELAVYGSGWEGLIDTQLVKSEFIPNEDLHRVYSSASLVLCDHWDDMRQHGFVSNRVFDALACGALVVSDDMPELHALFDEGVLTYQTPDELGQLVERMLADPAERARRSALGRSRVLAGHTFAHRVQRLLAEIERVRSTTENSLALAPVRP